MSTARIDSHQHFWQLRRGDYNWLTPELTPLYRDHLPQELYEHLQQTGVDRTVVVQAAATVAETEFLLTLAEQHHFIAGVVGWIDMDSPDALAQLAHLAEHPKLLGIRPMIQDIPDLQWMLRDQLTPVFETLAQTGLRFDALVKPAYLEALIQLLQRHPGLRVVIDHGAKPDISDDAFEPWADYMTILANNSSACCKLSGLLTEAAPGAGAEQLRPYVEHLLQSFGPQRLMWGSDWPVLNMASSYAEWDAICNALLSGLGETERAAIMGGTACEFYGLDNIS